MKGGKDGKGDMKGGKDGKDGKGGNVAPGTVAQKGVARPHIQNFFMVSHKAIKGTAVPAHYYVRGCRRVLLIRP